MNTNPLYKPFSAFTAMQDAQLALMLMSLHPTIDSVLLTGKAGTGKTSLVQSFKHILTDKKIIKLPLSITEETLGGNLDIEQTLEHGEWKYETGILDTLHNNILFIDNINLLSERVLNLIIQIQENGYYLQLGKKKDCNFKIIATMNPEEGGITTKILDRFLLFVSCDKSNDKHFRIEIIQQENDFEKDKEAFQRNHREEDDIWKTKVKTATENISKIKIKDSDLQTIVQICKEAFVAGHRGDLALLWACIANASLEGRKYITFEDIKRVKDLALAHRIRSPKQAPQEETPKEENQQQQNEEEQKKEELKNPPTTSNDKGDNEEQNQENNTEQTPLSNDTIPQNLEEDNEEEEHFNIANIQLQTDIIEQNTRNIHKNEGVGKRIKCKNTEGNGRHIRSIPLKKESIKDIDFIATLRAAAPFQKLRPKTDLAISIHSEDLHKKVREHRIGNTILFLVDASGSMGINQRMQEAKAGIFSLLKNAYVHRDKVGLMTFRREQAELVLPPTRSIEKAYQLLEALKTGGRTPLLHALRSALNLLQSLQTQNKENIPLLIFFTDGKATSSYKQENIMAEIQQVALQFKTHNIESILIDTECGFLKLGYAKKIGEWLGAKYYHLDELKEKSIKKLIEEI